VQRPTHQPLLRCSASHSSSTSQPGWLPSTRPHPARQQRQSGACRARLPSTHAEQRWCRGWQPSCARRSMQQTAAAAVKSSRTAGAGAPRYPAGCCGCQQRCRAAGQSRISSALCPADLQQPPGRSRAAQPTARRLPASAPAGRHGTTGLWLCSLQEAGMQQMPLHRCRPSACRQVAWRPSCCCGSCRGCNAAGPQAVQAGAPTKPSCPRATAR
jgi:hypothetical protein